MTKNLSPAQAAQLIGVSRSTISRAIKSLELKASRNNQNHWRIDEPDLIEWSLRTGLTTGHDQPNAQADQSNQIEIAELRAEVRGLRDQLDELRQDRDAWQNHANQLAKPKPSFLAQLFRGSRNSDKH